MAKHANKKVTAGTRNADRKNGKAWKSNLAPAVREAARKARAVAKKLRKQG